MHTAPPESCAVDIATSIHFWDYFIQLLQDARHSEGQDSEGAAPSRDRLPHGVPVSFFFSQLQNRSVLPKAGSVKVRLPLILGPSA